MRRQAKHHKAPPWEGLRERVEVMNLPPSFPPEGGRCELTLTSVFFLVLCIPAAERPRRGGLPSWKKPGTCRGSE